jgi:uncharacterized damage-inducible protein DinB
MSSIPKLIDHLEWADARVLRALRDATPPNDKALGLFAHIIGSTHNWIARIRGTTATLPGWPKLSIEECERSAKENLAGLRQILAHSSAADMGRVVAYRSFAGDAYESTVEDILLHVAMHGSYHRGQIATLLRQGGGEPVATDFVAFMREAPPASRVSEPVG